MKNNNNTKGIRSMDIKTLVNKLDIGPFGLGWAYFKDGWAGIAEYICKKFSELLKKLPADQLKYYADIVKNVAKLITMVVDTFVKTESVKAAATATANAVDALATHIEDGNYTKAELDEDVDTIRELINIWKDVAK